MLSGVRWGLAGSQFPVAVGDEGIPGDVGYGAEGGGGEGFGEGGGRLSSVTRSAGVSSVLKRACGCGVLFSARAAEGTAMRQGIPSRVAVRAQSARSRWG